MSKQKKANTAIKYRIYPDDDQKTLINKTIGCSRLIYNLMLSYNKRLWPFFGTLTLPNVTYYYLEYPFLKEVDSLALANAKQQLIQALKNHFNNPKHFGLPVFKKRERTSSYTTNNQNGSIRIENNKIKLPKLGWVKLVYHKKLPSNAVIKKVIVQRTKTGGYYVAINYYDPEIEKLYEQYGIKPDYDVLLATGLDYSSPKLFVNELGQVPERIKYYRLNERKLARLQRKMSKCAKKDSNKYRKYRRRYNRLMEKIKNCRLDFYRKMALAFARCYDIVCVESLNMQNIANKKRHLGKSTYDNAWGLFLKLLEDKLRVYGGVLVRVDKGFASSKLCHHCGTKYSELSLSDREWVCSECGCVIDRDRNAAENILEEGIRLLRSGELKDLVVGLSDEQLVVSVGGTPIAGLSPDRYGSNPYAGVESVVPVEGCKTLKLETAKGYPVERGIKEDCCLARAAGMKFLHDDDWKLRLL